MSAGSFDSFNSKNSLSRSAEVSDGPSVMGVFNRGIERGLFQTLSHDYLWSVQVLELQGPQVRTKGPPSSGAIKFAGESSSEDNQVRGANLEFYRK